MSPTVIIKKSGKSLDGKGSSIQGFTRHWNTSIAKNPVWIGTRNQYDRELKSRGLMQYDPDYEPSPKLKEHKVTFETRKLVNSIRDQSDTNGNLVPSGVLMEELIKRKVVRKRSEVEKIKMEVPITKQGGFY